MSTGPAASLDVLFTRLEEHRTFTKGKKLRSLAYHPLGVVLGTRDATPLAGPRPGQQSWRDPSYNETYLVRKVSARQLYDGEIAELASKGWIEVEPIVPPPFPRQMQRFAKETREEKKAVETGLHDTLRVERLALDADRPPHDSIIHYATAALATAAHEELLAELAEKGYLEVLAAATPSALDGSELDARLATLPAAIGDDPQPFLAFGEWLASQGHPWGELFSLGDAIDKTSEKQRAALEAKREQLVRANGPAILGAAADSDGRLLEWRHGFLRAVTLASPIKKPTWAPLLDALATLPAARYLEKVALVPQLERKWAKFQSEVPSAIKRVWTPKLLEHVPPRVTEIDLGGVPVGRLAAYVAMPDLRKIVAMRPTLRALAATGACNDLTPLELRSLRSLELRFAAATPDALRALTETRAPQLERLAVWLGAEAWFVYKEAATFVPHYQVENYEAHDPASLVDADDVRRLLAAPWPSLRHLALPSARLDTAMCEAILASPLVARLETLDLSGGLLDDTGAALLAKEKKRLAHLTRIDLRRNRMTKGAIAITKALPAADVTDQRLDAALPEFHFLKISEST